MELLSVIVGLETLKVPNCEVTVYSDSKYVVDAVEQKWVFGWEQKGFKGKKNPDLWRRFLRIYRQHKVHFVWLKGHNGHPENERCDQLAVAASFAPNLLQDSGYVEQTQEKIGAIKFE
jgi:ribonuclease HI